LSFLLFVSFFLEKEKEREKRREREEEGGRGLLAVVWFD